MNPSGHERALASPVYHVITPGDHFSPRTGSAIPTVVHGLAEGALQNGDSARFPQHVVVQCGTYTPRYASATPVEFTGADAPGGRQRALDALGGRLGFPRRGALGYFRPAIECLRSAQPGFVLAHNAPVVATLAKGMPHAVMLYAHNDVLRSYSPSESARVLGTVARILCVSAFLASELRRHLPASLHDRVRVVANGADTERFSPASRPRRAGVCRVMFIGRMIPEKGADLVLDAAALLRRTDIEVVVVGSHGFDAHAQLSPYEQQLRARAADVPCRVTFEPFADRSALPELLRQADILVVPSRWNEPSTLTVGEGLASGLPVIAARAGGIPEVLGDAGILVSPDSAAELATAIARVVDDPRLRASLREKALAHARAHDWRWSWQQLAAVLDETEAAR